MELDENWCSGAKIAAFDGQNMTVGIGRVMKQPEKSHLTDIQPHLDGVPANTSNLVRQYSANIYLSVPEQGGELELWDLPPKPTCEPLEIEDNYDWRTNYPNSLMVKPKQGELILINTRRPHAIKSFSKGHRVTQQCFIGHQKTNDLVLWN